MKFRKPIFQNIVLLLVVLVILFVLLEIFVRIAEGGRINLEEYSEIKHRGYNPFLIFGPNIDRDFKQDEGFVHWNSQGFRMEDNLSTIKLNEYRIFALGASSTENIGNNMNLHYCGEAMRMLNEEPLSDNLYIDAGIKYINCINTGKSAWSSAHTLVRFEFDILQFNPDMITVMHNINDVTVNLFPGDVNYNYANKFLNPGFAIEPDFYDDVLLRKSKFLYVLDYLKDRLVQRLTSDKLTLDDGSVIYTSMR
ncbi:SGNH/GDSL hydrolase family protein, partial [Candidatus Woesearchaeota archaeon]|nr:SGNH/GDSL hydrolase family protein [Candidatus Woesearchaeota archaeon]